MSKNNFDEIYEYVKKECFGEVEAERKRINKIRNTSLIIGFSISILLFIVLQSFNILPILITLIVTYILSTYNSNYTSIYKDKIIKSFIKAYDNNLVYLKDRGISSSIYAKAGFESNYDKFISDDLIEGTIDDCPILFAEVHTKKEYEDDKGNTSYQTIFHGAFACSEIKQEIHDKITIHNDKGFLGKIFNKKNKVEMDSVDFEKIFDVHSENRLVTMQILTPDIMNLMLDFIKKYNIKFEITIDKYNIYTRFYTGSIFEPTESKYALSKDYLKRYYDIINFVFDFTKLINKAVNETYI